MRTASLRTRRNVDAGATPLWTWPAETLILTEHQSWGKWAVGLSRWPIPPEGGFPSHCNSGLQGERQRPGSYVSCLLLCSEAVRSAWRSPQTNLSAKAAANSESRLPIDRNAARLTTVSSASL